MVEDLTYPVLVSLSKTEWEYIVGLCIALHSLHCPPLSNALETRTEKY